MEWSKLPGNHRITLYFQDETEIRTNINHMAYFRNHLFINGHPVGTEKIGEKLYWNDGKLQGCLSFVNETRILRGNLLCGNSVIPFKGSADSVMNLTFSNTTGATKKYRLCMESRMENGSVISYTALKYEKEDVILGYCRSHEKADSGIYHTCIRGTLLPSVVYTEGFSYFDAAFDDDYIHMTGYAWEKEENCDKTSPVFKISGAIGNQENEIRKAIISCSSERASACRPCTKEQRILLDGQNMLMVEELFSMDMPIVEDVNNDYPQMLDILMKYYINDEQRKYIGNPNRPERGTDLPSDIADIIDKEENRDIRDFLTGEYYYAYFSQILASNKSLPYAHYITGISKYQERLNGYYSGSLSTSMSVNKAYTKLSGLLYPLLYFRNSPSLTPYLDKKSEWAKKLHEYSMYNENSIYMIDDFSHGRQSSMQQVTIMLNYFDDSPRIAMKHPQRLPYTNSGEAQEYRLSYGSDLYYQLYNRSLTMAAYTTSFDNMVINKEERKQICDALSKELVAKITANEELADWQKELHNAIKEAIDEGEISCLDEAYGYLSFILTEFEASIAGKEPYILPCFNKWLQNHPKIKSGLHVSSLALCQLLMFANQIVSFADWEHLSAAARAETILSLLYTVTDIGFPIGEAIYKCRAMPVAGITPTVVNAAQNTVRATQAAGETERAALDGCVRRYCNGLEDSLKEMSVASKVSGSILSALAFAVSVCDICNDKEIYGTGAVYWLDITTSVINGIAFLATAGFAIFGGTLLGMTTFAALLPGIGWACTIAGILFSFITFLVKTYSKPLEESYIVSHCVPFVENLAIPENEDNIFDMVYDEKTNSYHIITA